MSTIPASSFGSNLARQMESRPSDRFYRLFWDSRGRRGGHDPPESSVDNFVGACVRPDAVSRASFPLEASP
jgi:hypothetical protein